MFNDNVISISTSKGMVFIDGEMVRVVTAVATASPQESAKTLEQMKLKLESNIKQLKQKGSIEEIEKSLVRLEKLNADIMFGQSQEQRFVILQIQEESVHPDRLFLFCLFATFPYTHANIYITRPMYFVIIGKNP